MSLDDNKCSENIENRHEESNLLEAVELMAFTDAYCNHGTISSDSDEESQVK
jgi:hypothetical protein